MYRLVFCDLDGTVATHDGQVRLAVREAMQAVVDAGAWITISTGRGYQTVRSFVGIVAINAPLVCCNGGLIVDPSTREVLFLKPMSLGLAHDLVRLAEEEGITMWFYLPDMETMLDNHADAPGFVLRRDGVVIRRVGDPIAELTQPPHKVVIPVEPPELAPAVVARVQQRVGDRARVLASRPQWVEVIMPGISKAWALSWVASHLGVQQEETIAIGDGDNDVEMLEWAGCGIAMGNATPAAKATADWIAPSVEEDGVATALRRFVLGL